jgi:hypothetical protein
MRSSIILLVGRNGGEAQRFSGGHVIALTVCASILRAYDGDIAHCPYKDFGCLSGEPIPTKV